ncbi:unnamed protein product [Sphagnum jensenii]|uniref:Uncharacterized protein n=1 Tax=Sphagnum jensenii TaxID=128206 RepID=A0ABP0XAA5_9BRYO
MTTWCRWSDFSLTIRELDNFGTSIWCMESIYGTYGTTTFPGIQTALAQALDESNEHDKMMQKSKNGQQCSMRYGELHMR